MEDELWKAIEARDTSLRGQIFYGVVTTGIFCQPGCPARAPRRENVRVYASAEEAMHDGLRACLRCKPLAVPDAEQRERFREVCLYIRRNLQDAGALRLKALSRRFSLSPFHFQRSFKQVIGMTPRQYVEALRMETLKENLRSGTTVTGAIYNAGYGSSSRLHAAADTHLGMTPSDYRAGGRGLEISYALTQTPLGLVMIGATDRGLCFLEFGTCEAELLASLREEFPRSTTEPMPTPHSDQFRGWQQALCGYLAQQAPLSSMPLTLHGTAFQTRVWRYLQSIPSGTVQTYTDVAKAIGRPRAVRAVAGACAANRIAILVPCHRVIRGDGGMGGYRWGLERKRALLDLEQRAVKQAGIHAQ